MTEKIRYLPIKGECPYCVENLRALAKKVKKGSKSNIYLIIRQDISNPGLFHVINQVEADRILVGNKR